MYIQRNFLRNVDASLTTSFAFFIPSALSIKYFVAVNFLASSLRFTYTGFPPSFELMIEIFLLIADSTESWIDLIF